MRKKRDVKAMQKMGKRGRIAKKGSTVHPKVTGPLLLVSVLVFIDPGDLMAAKNESNVDTL